MINDKDIDRLEEMFDEMFDKEKFSEDIISNLQGESDSDEDELPENIIILNDDNGNEIPFEFLDLIEFMGKEYVVLLPIEEEEETGEVVILMVEHVDEDNEAYVSVEDETALSAVFEIFKERFRDEFNFVD